MSWLGDKWDRLTSTEKIIWQGTVWSAILYLLHFDLYTTWFVEDAAISFSFARNFASGEGLVAYAGGEAVEGFSNPSWTLSLAAFSALGINPFISAKLLGAFAGLLTLPLAALWTNSLRGEPTPYAALAPLLLALSPQFVAWNASGLENAFFSLLLTASCLSVLRQTEQPSRYPWAGLLWALLAITRPEAPVYALIGLGFGGVWVLRLHGLPAFARWALAMGASFGIPFVAWHVWRYDYFAWEFPNTYYAKLGENRFAPWRWNTRGWSYLRGFALSTAHGFLIPIYVLGQTGLRGKGALVGLLLTSAAFLLSLPGIKWLQDALAFAFSWEDPEWLIAPRVVAWVLLAAIVPLLGLRRVGSPGRTLAWGFVVAILAYTLYVGGDWMSGFRWLSLLIVPLIVLLTDGIIALTSTLRSTGFYRSSWAALALLIATPGLVGAGQSALLISMPETSPYDVRRRVLYIEQIRQRLGIDHITQMEVDMGAHLWWGDAHYVDMAGLTDLPMGHHTWELPFVGEYVYLERNPDFAHVHGGWAKRTKMRRHPEWKNYLEMTGYAPNVWNRHVGNFIRRDLVFQPEWPGGTARQVQFGTSVELVGWHAPSLPVTPGHAIHLTLGWRRGRTRVTDFRALVYLANDEHITIQEMAPIYDWLAPSRWRRTEIAMSHHSLPVPANFPPGRYDLGVLVIDTKNGEVIEAKPLSGNGTTEQPRLALGEVRWPSVVGVVGSEKRDLIAAKKLFQLDKQAGLGNCPAAVNLWKVFRGYYPGDHPMVAAISAEKSRSLARCFSTAAASTSEPDEAAYQLQQALRWNHRDPQVRARASLFADAQEGLGEQQLAAAKLDEAYNSWRRALIADPSRTQLRRRTEALRDQRHLKPEKGEADAAKPLD